LFKRKNIPGLTDDVAPQMRPFGNKLGLL